MKKSFKYTVNQGLPGGPNELKKFIQGSISVTGYKSDSPDVNNDFNIIPSNQITMQGVNFPVLGIDNLGNEQMMMPGGEYTFPGDYVTELPQMGKGGLTQWFAEEWTDVKTGKKCGRSGKEKGSRPYPACRPKKRVNETTPKTTSEMSSAEKAKFKRSKTSGKRISYNHKRREDGGEIGWLDRYQDGGYTISPGDTFFGIANKFGVTRKEMIGSNPDVNFEKIKAGQRLRVPETFDTAQGYPTGYFETMTPATFDAMGKPIPQVAPKPKVTPQPTSNVQLGPEIFLRQAFAESTFNPKAKSPAGYMGLAQIGDDVIADYRKATGAAKVDPYNPADNAKVQQWAMNQIYNSEFVNKENQDPGVRLAKTLASYNWGKGNVRNYLTKQKKKGVDIYNSMDWVEGLPKETRDYIHKIQVGDMNDFEKEFNKAKTNKKYSPYINLYKKKSGGQTNWLENYI